MRCWYPPWCLIELVAWWWGGVWRLIYDLRSDCLPSFPPCLTVICCWTGRTEDWLTLHYSPVQSSPASVSCSVLLSLASGPGPSSLLQSAVLSLSVSPGVRNCPTFLSPGQPASVRDTSWQICDDFLPTLIARLHSSNNNGWIQS